MNLVQLSFANVAGELPILIAHNIIASGIGNKVQMGMAHWTLIAINYFTMYNGWATTHPPLYQELRRLNPPRIARKAPYYAARHDEK